MSKLNVVEPTKLTLDSKFKFRCHKEVKCFTKCCRDIEILLTPYDIVRLKDRLGITAEEFLNKYTYMKVDEQTSHPYAFLQMTNEDGNKCPFVTADGCTVYSDRPANCRYYPIGQGTYKKQGKTGPEDVEFYFFIREKHCLGYEEDTDWTIASWRSDQEVDLYDKVNREWKNLQLRKQMPGQADLDVRKQTLFYMASYDFDSFRRFIFESRFLEVFDVDDKTLNKIKDDDIELIQFGAKYLKDVMMLERTMKVKDAALKEKEENK